MVTVPWLLLENFVPVARLIVPVTNSSPDIARLALGPMQISPRIPPAGPVMETFAAPSSKTMHPSASPNPNCGLTHFPTLVAEVTTRVMEQSVCSPACSPLLSVAVNVFTYVPTSAAVGVQEKVLLTGLPGLPLVGKRGVMVAPA